MKKIIAAALIAGLMLVIGACGKKNTGGGDIVKTDSGSDRPYDVTLDERSEKESYVYSEDDLSLVDTQSGKKITLNMSRSEIEAVTGEAEEKIMNDYTYDGVIVRYKDDTAVSLIVSGGKFKDGRETRYKTVRGIGIGAAAADFKKAYGSEFSEGSEDETEKTPSRAVRYFDYDGKRTEFLGTKLSREQKSEDTSNYYLQDFLFSNTDGTIATIRVSLLSEI